MDAHTFNQGCQLSGQFGLELAKVSDGLIEAFRAQEAAAQGTYQPLFEPGERVRLTEAPFTDVEGIYHIADGEGCAMLLIELLSKQVRVWVVPARLCKVG